MNAPDFICFAHAATMDARTCVTGHLVEILPDGRALVDFPSNLSGPLAARSVVQVNRNALHPGVSLLLALDEQDRLSPVILGVVSDCLVEADPLAQSLGVYLDGKRLEFVA